jgi:hypothetical protein
MMKIRAVVIVKDFRMALDRTVVVGEVPGPWPTVEAAVGDVVLDGQPYRVSGDLVLAQEMPDPR